MQLYLIRHAQSENNALYDNADYNRARSMDPELTELGFRQAEYLARFLIEGPGDFSDVDDPHNRSGFGLSHLYSSLMVRAVATGAIISRALGLPLIGWRDWHEGGGIYLEDETTGEPVGYPGKDRNYFKTYYPNLLWPADLDDGCWWNQPFEERPQRWARARRVLNDLMARHGGTFDRVAVIMHGGFYNYFMKTLFGIEPGAAIWFVMNNTAITRIDFTGQETRLVYQNRLEHLPTELVSLG